MATILVIAVAATISTVVITTTTAQQVQASDDRTVQPEDSAGVAGWKEGKNDYLNGNHYEHDCPSENTDTYCMLYKMGYERGWQAQINLGREYGSDPR
jgi:hypothetical protein